MRPIETVLVVGRDAALWLSALSLQRAFGGTGLVVQALELPSALGPADVYASTPTLQGLHRMLGVQEAQLLAACAGAFTFGQRFSDWSRTAPAFLHPYDTHGARLNNVDFAQFYVKARGEGMKVQLEEFSLGAAAAKTGRFVEHTDGTERFSKASFGYRLDASRYVAFIRQQAIRGNVAVTTGEPLDVRCEDGRITGVALADGRLLQADLYLDASGVEAILIGRMEGDQYESWSQWLPCDLLVTGSGRSLDPLPGFNEIAALPAGHVGLYPLQDRTAVQAAVDTRHTTQFETEQAIVRKVGGRLDGLSSRPLRAGMRVKPWLGNCVAIGEAAVSLAPLDATTLHDVHVGISHLISLFPLDAERTVASGLYNDTLTDSFTRTRDFQIAHYKLNGRTGETFWDTLREMQVPPALQYRLEAFAARGIVPDFDNETFEPDDWLALMIGHGLLPGDYDPLAERVPQDEQIENFQRMLRFIAAEAREMPSIKAHMELSLPSPSRAAF